MHFVFIPYGRRDKIELLLREMEAQKHKLLIWKGKEKKQIWVQGSVRILPFGLIEYIFPKEDMDVVLNTLIVEKDRYQLGKARMGILRKILRCKPIPEYKQNNKLLWVKEDVNLIPIGIREDINILSKSGEYKGWMHEGL